MKNMTVTEMNIVNGGASVTKSSYCGWCGKKYSVTLSYWKWMPFHKWYVSNLAVIGARRKAKDCENAHWGEI
ncbi:MAG: hypothetical protein IJ391_00225 [Clostridia bacterium]|nr:hypothetical protein [Clostridia bacterium]